MNISDFFKKVKKMLGFKSSLGRLGIRTVASDKMTACIAEWSRLYEGENSGKLKLASAISSEIARLVTVELKSEISGSPRADFLNTPYTELLQKIRNITEYAAAKGGIVLKPYVENGMVKVSLVQAEDFVPTSYDSSQNITGAAFADRRFKDGKVYTRIEHHFFDGGKYHVCNYAFVSQSAGELGRQISLLQTDFWDAISPEVVIEDIKKPLFAYFKMPSANREDSSSPLGVSVFSGCTELMADAEKQYDTLLWEFKSGERALFVDTNAVKRDKNGNEILPDRRLYKLLNADETLFEDWTPTLREQSIINGLNEILRKIEFNSGLAYGTLSDVRSLDKTAEEIKASKQRSYANVCDIQKSLKNALCNLADAMNVLADLYGLSPEGDYSIAFEFDDSTVADRKSEFAEKLQLAESGIMAPWEVRMWYFGEDEETAKARIAENMPETALNYTQKADKTV